MLTELAQQFDVHPNQITQWKGQLLEGAAGVFGQGRTVAGPAPVDLKALHAKSSADFSVRDKWSPGFPCETRQNRLVDELTGHGLEPATCGKGIQVFPPYEFSVLFLLPKVALSASVFLLVTVFRGMVRQDRAPARGVEKTIEGDKSALS